MIKREPIAIAALTLVAVLGWVFCLGSEFAISSLKSEYALLNTRYNSLNEDYIKLSLRYDELNFTYEYIVVNEHLVFENVYSSLISYCRERERDYNFLYYNYNSLKGDYNVMEERYNELSSALSKCGAIAQSAEWVSEDECLKLTSELILVGTSWRTYTVKVTGCNTPISEQSKLYLLKLMVSKPQASLEPLFI